MTDPASIAFGVAGIVAPALHVSRLLLNDLKHIRDAPSSIQTLTDNIDSLTMALTAVKSIQESEWSSLGPAVVDNAKSTITLSSTACERFKTDIQRWSKRSKDGSLSWLDRSKIGFFKQTHITSMNGEVQTYQTKITSVVGIATLLKSIHQGQITEEIKQTLVSQQGELENASRAVEAEGVAIENKLKLLTMEDAPEDVEHQDTLKQLKEQQKTLEASQRLLEELLSRVQESAKAANATTKTEFGQISMTWGAQNSGIQLGINQAPINFTPK